MTPRSQDSHLTSQLLLIAMMAVLVSPFVLTTVWLSVGLGLQSCYCPA